MFINPIKNDRKMIGIMKIKGKEYQKEVIVPKVWEHIIVDGKTQTVLITKEVSTYIRELESKIIGFNTHKNIKS